MASKDPEQAVQEIYELANSSSCRSADERPPYPASDPFSSPSSSSGKRICRPSNYFVTAVAVLLIGGACGMFFFAGKTIHEVQKIHPKNPVSSDPEWPVKVDREFQIFILCAASFSFIHGAGTLCAMRYARVRRNSNLGFQVLCSIILFLVYVFTFLFEDVTSKHPVMEPEGIPVPSRSTCETQYPSIISWTCMKKDNPGSSLIAYGSICHTAVSLTISFH